MKGTFSTKRPRLLILTVVGVLLVLAACASAPAPTPAPTPTPAPSPAPAPAPTNAVNVAVAGGGSYLVDGNWRTLYYYTKDEPGKSNATADIIANWPIFYASSLTVPSPLNAADFGTITRSDGKKQTTYKGWPLYYYIKDKTVGDALGQGVNGVWFMINPSKFPPPAATSKPTSMAAPGAKSLKLM